MLNADWTQCEASLTSASYSASDNTPECWTLKSGQPMRFVCLGVVGSGPRADVQNWMMGGKKGRAQGCPAGFGAAAALKLLRRSLLCLIG